MQEGLGTRLRRLLAELDGGVQDVYDELGTSFRPRFYPIIRHLLTQSVASVSALADAAGVSQPAVTQTLNEMRKLNLIEAEAGADKRERLVRLSAEGAELAERLQPVWKAVHRAAGILESEVQEGLLIALDNMLAALRQQSFGDRVRAQMEPHS